jgi:two-component system chemotaxis response regulator CheB
MIRILVVDDSTTKRHLIRTILESDPELKVIAEAQNGEQAIELCQIHRPDLVTMDLFMPKMDGFEAISRIMSLQPLPILVLTTADLARTSFKALEAGALIILNTPQGFTHQDSDAVQLIAKVKMLAGVKVIRRIPQTGMHTRELQITPGTGPEKRGTGDLTGSRNFHIIAIGVSTGGPQALQAIFSHLPANFLLPIVVVQHISTGFVSGLVQWLGSSTPLRVKLAEQGETLDAGTIYFAPEQQQFRVRWGSVWLGDATPVDGHCPSANVLFESVALAYQQQAIGVLLTGMGEDGARGLFQLRESGAHTIAQDETSSVIFGMPKAAIDRGAVKEVLSLELIPNRLIQLLAGQKVKVR